MKVLVAIIVILFSTISVAEAQRAVVTHTTVSCAATTTVVVAANNDRNFLILQNDSTEDIYIKFGADAVLNAGVKIGASGGSLLLDYKFSAQAVNCISTSGSMNLLVSEGVVR